ncbi:MAG: hypothetical protein EOO40_03960, partial [Deltaproteobacteria bacterium]
QPLTLPTACEREPIHVPGCIQPFGALLCVHATRRQHLTAGGVDA